MGLTCCWSEEEGQEGGKEEEDRGGRGEMRQRGGRVSHLLLVPMQQ